MKYHLFWVSWWHTEALGDFTLDCPCWRTGQRDSACGELDELSYCAVVTAKQGEDVLAVIKRSYAVEPSCLEWRFVVLKQNGWVPEPSRFPMPTQEPATV